MDAGTLLVFDTSTQEITVGNLMMPHPGAELVLLTFRTLKKGSVARYYYGSPAYAISII